MASTKYDPTFPKLVEGYAREGLLEKHMMKKLGVSAVTFEKYKRKYPDFLEALKKGKEPVDFQVENALLKRALGFEYDEIHTEYGYRIINEEGATEKYIKSEKLVRKQVIPDTTAQIFWLKNRRPRQWRDRPADESDGSERTIYEIHIHSKKIIEDLKKL